MIRSSLLFLALIVASMVLAQEPVPTLTVPTLVPIVDTPADALSTESAVADIIATGVFRVGVLYNEPPYSEFTLQGDLRGFDIDLLRQIVDAWGSEIEFVQVTRQNALDQLNRGRVHAVASAYVHYRDLDDKVEFSQTYLIGRQAVMVRAESAYNTLGELSGQAIGYVIGTRAEKALSLLSARLDTGLNLQYYLNLDRAFAALTAGEVEAVVAEEQDLLRVTSDYVERIRILDEAVTREPHAFAVRHQDIAMRQLLNRSIQLLTRDKELQVLSREYFPEATFPEDSIALWDGIGEEVKPAQHSRVLTYPTRYAVPRVLGTGFLRVNGIAVGEQGNSAGERKLAELNRAIVNEIARRWGVAVEFVEGSAENAADLLSSGEVDIAAGMKLDWRQATAIDFSSPYLLHGDRLMVPANSGIEGFNDLRGDWIAVLSADDTAEERAQAWADSINATVNFIETPESRATQTLLDFNNADAVYADSLALLAHLEANPNALRLTDRWYSRSYYAFGLPYNDPEFRLLVDYTIQELVRDGTLYRLSASLILSDELPDFAIIPGAATVAGINLSAS